MSVAQNTIYCYVEMLCIVIRNVAVLPASLVGQLSPLAACPQTPMFILFAKESEILQRSHCPAQPTQSVCGRASARVIQSVRLYEELRFLCVRMSQALKLYPVLGVWIIEKMDNERAVIILSPECIIRTGRSRQSSQLENNGKSLWKSALDLHSHYASMDVSARETFDILSMLSR